MVDTMLCCLSKKKTSLKKAQISSQVFVFVMAALIISLTIFFGIKLINHFRESGKELEFVKFERGLKSIINDLDANEEVVYNLQIPQGVSQVCFCGPEDKPGGMELPECKLTHAGEDITYYIQQEKSINPDSSVFLIMPDHSVKPIQIPNLYSEFMCFKKPTKLLIKGIGKYVVVEEKQG